MGGDAIATSDGDSGEWWGGPLLIGAELTIGGIAPMRMLGGGWVATIDLDFESDGGFRSRVLCFCDVIDLVMIAEKCIALGAADGEVALLESVAVAWFDLAYA